ncbi:MAG: branched-chain amino acid ABC transporter permease, partial [Myxococcaceae bacterium]
MECRHLVCPHGRRAAGTAHGHLRRSGGSSMNNTFDEGSPLFTRGRSAVAVAFIAFLAVLPALLGDNRAMLAFLVLIAIYATAAQSIVLLYGSTGIMSVGQGALVGVAGYVTAITTVRTELPFVAVVLVAILVSFAVSGLLALTSIRTGGHYFVIVTFAFGEIAVAFGNNLSEWTGGNGGMPFVRPLELLGVTFGPVDLVEGYYLCAVVLLIAMGTVTLLRHGRFGNRLMSLRENQKLAAALGVNVALTKVVVFVVAGLFTSLAGVLWAYQTRFLAPEQFSPAALGITLVLAALIGGSRSAYGPVLGATIALLGPHLFGLSPYVNEMLLGLVFVLVILLMPEGIVGGVEGLSARLRRRRGGGESPSES